MRRLLFLALLTLVSLSVVAQDNRAFGVGSGNAARRVALVIGNGAYPVGRLANPTHDASAIAGLFKSLGFDTQLLLNAGKGQIDSTLKTFSRKARDADTALVFYAGHGIQANGVNYLVPVDARSEDERDLKREMIKLDDIIDDMGNARVKLVFWDACRDNPLARSLSRGGIRGMAAPAETSGTLISFATRHGSTAADGTARHSPYTESLLAELRQAQGVEVETLLRRVQQGVRKATRGQQEPWRYGSLDGDYYFVSGAPATVSVPIAPADPDSEAWKAADSANNISAVEAYLTGYPQGKYATAASIKLAALKTREVEANFVAGKVFRDCPDCPEMVVIPPGSFMMGSTRDEEEQPVHTVRIPGLFAMGRTEVTQRQWRNLMGENPPGAGLKGCDDCPVNGVNWHDIQAFIQKLNARTGKQYRLPGESEWEYACRAGGQHEYCGNNNPDTVAWYNANSSNQNQRVAQKQPNAWGLYDMSGNVWEWVEDCFHYNYKNAPDDGSPWTTGGCDKRMLRGGSASGIPALSRSASRSASDPLARWLIFGFRLARTLP